MLTSNKWISLAAGLLLSLLSFNSYALNTFTALPYPSGAGSPTWVMPGNPRYDFDFANNRYVGTDIWLGTSNNISKYTGTLFYYSGASEACNTLFVQWRDGIVRPSCASSQTTINVPRRSDYGIWIEGAAGNAHNYALWSRDFTQSGTWTLVGMTAAKTATGADGVANSATLLTATSSINSAAQTTVIANKTVTCSAWVKRVTGTGTFSISCDNVTFTDVSGLINSSTWTQVRVPTVTVTNAVAGVKFGTNGDAVDIDFFQDEDDDQATSPILTTNAINQRGPENIFIGTNASDFNYGLQVINATQAATPVTYYMKYSGNFSTTLVHGLLTSDSGFQISGAAGGGAVTGNINGATIVTAASDVSGLYLASTGTGTVNKVIFSADGAGAMICINGSAPITATTPKFQTSTAGTHNNILNNGANILPTNGYIAEEAIWLRKVTAGECSQYSTVTNNQ